MIEINIDMIQTAGLGTLALILGTVLTRQVHFLRKFCIPAPVSGGIIFSLLTLALYQLVGIKVVFDDTLQRVFMLAFFTSVGLQSDLKVLKQGGKTLIIMLLLLVVIISIQNAMPLGVTRLLDVNPLVGMAAGSISMTGGHGTAGGFAGLLEQLGLHGAGTIAMAAATFGLVAGSMIGGPIAERLISRKLKPEQRFHGLSNESAQKEREAHKVTSLSMVKATYCLILIMAGGTLVSKVLLLTGITFPTYFGSLILAVIARNIMSMNAKTNELIDMDATINVGNICLTMFLGMAMMSLELWELQSLALPLVVILFCQVGVLALFVYFIAFRILGKDYDAAVLVSGICGFGLGATPNAMANMSAVCNKYHYSVKPFLIVPIIGAMFADLVNTAIITLFLNGIGG